MQLKKEVKKIKKLLSQKNRFQYGFVIYACLDENLPGDKLGEIADVGSYYDGKMLEYVSGKKRPWVDVFIINAYTKKWYSKELEDFKGESEGRKKLIAALEVKNDSLNQEKGALEVKIATLNTEIDQTNQKLDDSEGDRTFLEGELLRLQEEKAKLVKQMNDIEFLTAQYRRIKADIAVAKRMDWMRRGIGIYAKRQTVSQKHAVLRGEGSNGEALTVGAKGNENVSVELTSDGLVIINGKVIEPTDETPKTAPAPLVPQD